MRLPDGIKGWLLSGALGTVALATAFLCGSIYEGLRPTFLTYVLPSVSRDTLLALVGLLGMAALLLAAWVLYLHRVDAVQDRLRGFEFDAKTAIARRKSDQKRVCSRCLVDLNSAVPLICNDGETWICIRKDCQTQYVEKRG